MKKIFLGLLGLVLSTALFAQQNRVIDPDNPPTFNIGATNIPWSFDTYGRLVVNSGNPTGTPSFRVGQTNITPSMDARGRILVNDAGGGGGGGVTKITAGTGISISPVNGLGNVTINATGTGTPGGSNTQVQFNDSGSFGGSSFLVFDKSTGALGISGSVTTGAGSGVAGTLELKQGTPPLVGTTSVKILAPTLVTSYNRVLEGSVGSTGLYLGTVSGTTVTDSKLSSVTVSLGGTGNTSLTAYAPIFGGTTSTGATQSGTAGSSGQILRSGGASAIAGWSTATYPSTAGTSGNVLTSDGTNWVSQAPAAGGETVISPSQITGGGDTANYSPTGLSTATVIRISGDANLNQISGIAAQTSYKRLRLWNVGSNTMILRDQLAGLSTSGNRFANSGSDIPLFPDGTIDIQYDDTSSVWRPIAPTSRVIPPLGKGVYVNYGYTTVLGSATFFNMAGSSNGTASGTGNITSTATSPTEILYAETGTDTTGKAMIQGNNGHNITLSPTFYWRLNFKINSSTASDGTNTFTLRTGWSDQADGSSDATDGVYLRYTNGTNSGNWVLVLRNNSSESTTNLSAGPTFSSTVWNDIAIIASPTKVEVWQNGVNIGSTTTLTNMPTARATDVTFSIAKSAGASSRILNFSGAELIGYRATPTQ